MTKNKLIPLAGKCLALAAICGLLVILAPVAGNAYNYIIGEGDVL